MSGREVRRRLERERPQNIGQALEPRLIRREPPGVAGGEFCDLGLGPAGTGLQITPVGQGQEVRQRALDDPEAMGVQIEVADDLRVEERDGVGGDRIAEAGMEFLGDRRAADLPAPLEHRDLEAGRGEIGRGDKAVMAAADDDDVGHPAPAAFPGPHHRPAVRSPFLAMRGKTSRSRRLAGLILPREAEEGSARSAVEGAASASEPRRARQKSNLTPCASGSLADS